MRTERVPGAAAGWAPALLAAVLLLVTGCAATGASTASPPASAPASSPAAPSTSAGTAPPDRGSVRVERTVATGLDSPWGAAVLPGGDLLVGSRDTGRLVRIDPATGAKTAAGTVPGVAARGEGGLLGITLSPSFATDRTVYAYLTTASDNRIVRMTYTPDRPAGERLGTPATVLSGIPKGQVHNGGRIAFGPDRMLYAGTGESGERGLAQDRGSLGGKILRMTPDGAPAPDNPFPGSVVYSTGHRNVQGLAWDAAGRLWATEFGQDTWDELNLIRPGGDYGWPVVEGRAHRAGFTDPVVQWRPDDASPSGLAIDRGSAWIAALHGERLWRVPLDGTHASAAPRAFLTDHGRLRTVLDGPDGSLYVITSNTDGRGDPAGGDDRVLRLSVT